MRTIHKNITIALGTYLELKRVGFAGDSFNDVISELIQDRKNKVAVGSGLRAQDQAATKRTATTIGGANDLD